MTLTEIRRLFNPTIWAVLIFVTVAGLLGAAWFVTEPGRQKARAVEGAVTGALGQARSVSASEAAAVADRARDSADQNETLSRENADAIDRAPGADQRLNSALNDIGRRGLCKRAAYRRSAECVQLLGPPLP